MQNMQNNLLTCGLCSPAAGRHQAGKRSTKQQTRTALADAHGTSGRARHQRTRTARALADAHGTGGRARPGH